MLGVSNRLTHRLIKHIKHCCSEARVHCTAVEIILQSYVKDHEELPFFWEQEAFLEVGRWSLLLPEM